MIVIVIVILGAIYYLKNNSKFCAFMIGQENRESCYMELALKMGDSTICSNLKELYRQKRCMDLVKSTDTTLKESILKNLQK
jgi:hypothetical protein